MKRMCAQTRPRFILSSEGVLGGMEFEPMLTPREKSPLPKMSPEEDRTRDAVDSEQIAFLKTDSLQNGSQQRQTGLSGNDKTVTSKK